MQQQYEQLAKYLDTKGIEYIVIEHKAEELTDKVTEIRGHTLQEGCKSILLRYKSSQGKGYVIANVPGNLRVDLDKVKKALDVTEIRMAFPEELKSVLGCMIGEVPPFGEAYGIPSVFDKHVFENEWMYFNAAVLDKSIKMKTLQEGKIDFVIKDIAIYPHD